MSTSKEPIWMQRVEDYRRHVIDLQSQTYEGARERNQREAIFRRAFDLLTPVAGRVLGDLNTHFLMDTGEFGMQPPAPDGQGGLIGSWSLSWPLLRKAANRFDGTPLEPLDITAVFPLKPSGALQWTHPHLAVRRPGLVDGLALAFPLQVTSSEDAERQEPILRVLAEGELHERFYQADLNWRILPFVMSQSET